MEDWDERYSRPLWSGRVNATLPQEVADIAVGTALDVGCGEGADAVWLATQGWDVTGLDVSSAALERGRAAAREADVTVEWLLGDLAQLAPTGFDLVAVHYPALPRAAADALVGAVAPGGTLLAVWHADVDEAWARERGIELADYVLAGDVRERLAGWRIVTDEVRPRPDAPPGAHHHDDLVLRAVRSA